MRPYLRKKTDSTHARIGKALRTVTPTLDVHEFGKIGCDFVAKNVVTGQPMFIEAKSPSKVSHRWKKNRYTANELLMSILYPDNWRRCETEDEALAAVGALGRVSEP